MMGERMREVENDVFLSKKPTGFLEWRGCSRRCSLFFVLFFSLFLCFSSGFAQEFKLMGGAAFSKYSKAPAIAWIYSPAHDSLIQYKSGLLAGLGVELYLTEKLSFEVDGMYFQKGSRYDYSDLIYDREMEFSLNVLSFPVLLRLKAFRKTSPYILGGGEFSVVLSHKSRVIIDGFEAPMEDERDKIKSYDLALVLGGGLEIAVKSISFFIEARYHPGLPDISRDKMYFTSLETSAVAVMVGLKI